MTADRTSGPFPNDITQLRFGARFASAGHGEVAAAGSVPQDLRDPGDGRPNRADDVA
jgi:hypothetical protein